MHTMTPNRTKTAQDILTFYMEAGVDTPMGETPVDRFADAAGTPPPEIEGPAREARREGARAGADPAPDRLRQPLSPSSGENKAVASAPPPPDAAVMAARAAAKDAKSLEELRAILEKFDGCALKGAATQLVFGDGNPKARVMFVGEAPGYEEDKRGLPFVGRSGQLLDRMMAAIGLDRTSAYIANIVPWRPPGNRTPTPQESQICLPFILRQIELVNPDILVCLGGPATQTLLSVTDGIMKTRGRWLSFNTGTREIRALATLHPAYLLRQPLAKRLAWRDFLSLKQALAKAAQP
jgi:DNA polymerase